MANFAGSEYMQSTIDFTSSNSIRAILFDLDGTIVNLYVNWSLVRHELSSCYVNALKLSMPDKLGITAMIQFAESEGHSNARALASEILQKYESKSTYSAMQNVISLIQQIPAPKSLALVTNNLHSTADRIIRELGLRNRFSAIVGFDDVLQSKPSPDGVLRALYQLGVLPREAILIGDSDSDRLAANAADTHFLCAREVGHCH